MDEVNLDGKVDYKKIYEGHIKKGKISGDNLVGLCPFHDDKKPSFGANLKTGVYNCLACGKKGNAITFLSKTQNISNKEAYKILLKEAGLYEDKTNSKTQSSTYSTNSINPINSTNPVDSTKLIKSANSNKYTKPTKYTVEDYCKEKKLDVDFIRSLGIRNGRLGITIPYMDEGGEVISNRQRYHKDHTTRFSWARGSKVNLYGLWKLDKAREVSRVILVEGESDCHALWSHGIEEALGVPGATTFHPDWVDKFQLSWEEGFIFPHIYIHHEGDTGADAFVDKICNALVKKDFKGKVYKISCSSLGAKDPSELHMLDPDSFSEKLKTIINKAVEIDLKSFSLEIDNLIPNAPVKLKQPEGFRVSEDGIEMINYKTGIPQLICRTPILISNRLKSLDSYDEKIEITFYRDKKWHRVTEQRSVIFQARTIIKLADVGVTVTSENAKFLVKFLEKLEAENFDMIQTLQSVDQLGWHNDNFLPGREGELVIDVDTNERKWINAYRKIGTLDSWIKYMKDFRHNTIFRFILASSFAAPLLKLLNHRIFFVHNWGDSRSGKTAALKAALTVWGDPEELMTSFNATNVGLERLACFFNDLPLGIDERQVAGGKQEYIETLVYMLAMGYSKVRGAKTGGLQSQKAWRSIILTTGEEPLTTNTSQTGVHTRALEIHGSPFKNEEEAGKMHKISSINYGQAGLFFINKLMDTMKIHELQERHKTIQDKLMKANSNHKKLMSHISSVAVVTLADELISSWLFNDDPETSLKMGIEILSSLEDVMDTDIVEKAYEFVKGWMISNIDQFKESSKGQRFGIIDGDSFYVFPQILQEALEKQGLSYRKIIRGFGDRGYIGISYESDGKKRNSVVKKIEGRACRMISFDLSEAASMEETPPF